MKRNYILNIVLGLALIVSSLKASAQAPVPAPFQTPSRTTTPPATAAAVAQVLCSGSNIVLHGPVDGTGNIRYEWYKKDNTGTLILVKEGSANDNAYTETPNGIGYYTYQLVLKNDNDCTSDASEPFDVYVLPPLAATITTPNTNVCEKGQTSSVLTIQGLVSGYTYTYQWTRNAVDIAGATTDSYTVTEQTPGTITYGVKISYALNTTCSQTPTKVITVIAVPAKPTIQFGN